MTTGTEDPETASAARAAPPARGFARALDLIERLGNRLPDPATLFLVMSALVIAGSWLAARFDLGATHPRDGSPIAAVDLLTTDNVRRMFTEAVRNFTGFAPLGTVLVTMLGIGVAEASGLIGAAMRVFVMNVPRRLLTLAVVFVGVNGNLAADAGIIVLPPIAAILFAATGRHPLAGIAAAFAGVAGGFSANLLPSSLDPLLAGLTQEAIDASRLAPGYRVQILGNYYFMVAATPILAILGTWVTEAFVEPRLGPWRPPGGAEPLERATPAERRGLLAAAVAALLTVGAIAALTLPAGAPLRDPAATDPLTALRPFFDSIVVLIMVLFFVPGLAYGIAAGTVRNDRDVARMTADTMATMGTYIVLAFVAGQFVAYFGWSNLGAILAIQGAGAFQATGLTGPPLLLGLILLSATLDMLITSASAKWAVLGPIFVPMFALLGYSPEGTQMVFRVAESPTNIVSPLLPYLPFILAYVRRYEPRAGAGTVIAMMLPYAVAFLAAWSLMLLLFDGFGWPIGPGVTMRMPS